MIILKSYRTPFLDEVHIVKDSVCIRMPGIVGQILRPIIERNGSCEGKEYCIGSFNASWYYADGHAPTQRGRVWIWEVSEETFQYLGAPHTWRLIGIDGINDEQVGKIRRRVEDSLRKESKSVVMWVARILGVKID